MMASKEIKADWFENKEIKLYVLCTRTAVSAEEGWNAGTAGSSRPASRYGGDESHASGSEDAGDDKDRGTAQWEGSLKQQELDDRSVHNVSSAAADCQRSQLLR
jgi:hypothetical protein